MTASNRQVAALALATFAAGTEAYVYAGLLSDLAAELSVSLGQAGQLAAAFAITYALLAPPLASVTAHWPRRRVLTLGLAALGLVNLAAAMAPSFGWLLASRVLCGMLAALVGPSATAAASALVVPERRGRALAVVSAGTGLAFTVGVPLGSGVGGAFGWRTTFVFAGLLLVACAALIRLVVPRVPATDAAGLGTLGVALQPGVRWRLALTAAAFTTTFCSIAYLGPIAGAVAGARGLGVGLFQACIGLGSVAGLLLGGRLADRAGRGRTPAKLLALVAATQLGVVAAQGAALPVAPASALLAVSVTVGAGALFALMPVVQVELVGAAPERRNVVLALNGSMIFLGQGLGAALGGAVTSLGGLEGTGLVGAALAVLVMVALLAVRRGVAVGAARPS